MLAKRTDLALEARELWQESAENTGRLSGVRAKTSRQEGCPVTTVEILNDRGAKALGKPCGRYFSVDLKECLHRRDFDRAVRVVGRQLRLLTPREGSLLIVGLGNAAMTPDAIGPLTAQHLLVTRHLISALPEQFGAFRDVAVLTPGVLGSTGIETAEAVRSLAAQLCPAA